VPKYIQDADTKKQVPGSLPDNAYDRATVASFYKVIKTPNSVVFNTSGNDSGDIGFFFGSSASFSELDLNLSGTEITCSKNSNLVLGIGTSFDTELVSGDKIEFVSASESQVLIVDNIASATSMSLTANYTLEDFTGSSAGTQVTRRRSFMSNNYENYGTPADGTELIINPLAVSGSSADNNKSVIFIYKSGLSGPPRRF
tara:strand:+ start:309 stop:908 length:600 start_codon:yes stop_codon:yes gene_type:complete